MAHTYPDVPPPKHRSILLVIGIEDRERKKKRKSYTNMKRGRRKKFQKK